MLTVDTESHGKNDMRSKRWAHQLGAAHQVEARCRRSPRGKAAGHQAAAAPRRRLLGPAPTHPLVAGPAVAAASSAGAAAPEPVHARSESSTRYALGSPLHDARQGH